MALCPSPVLFHPVLSFIDCCCSCLFTPPSLFFPPPLYKLPVLHQLSSPSVTLALFFVPSTLHCLFHLLQVLFICLPYPDVLHSPLSVTGTGIKVQRLQFHPTVTSKDNNLEPVIKQLDVNQKRPLCPQLHQRNTEEPLGPSSHSAEHGIHKNGKFPFFKIDLMCAVNPPMHAHFMCASNP